VIRIARAPEPAALAPVRNQRLAAARDAALQGTKIDFQEYDLVKKDLAAMQHNKCCYCEKREEQAKYRDVEHYRPKSLYWWLACARATSARLSRPGTRQDAACWRARSPFARCRTMP